MGVGKRLGIVLSVVWFLGVSGVAFSKYYERYDDLYGIYFFECREEYGYPPNGPGSVDFCQAQTYREIDEFPVAITIFKSAAFAAIATAVLWLLFAIVWFPSRWILAGRQKGA